MTRRLLEVMERKPAERPRHSQWAATLKPPWLKDGQIRGATKAEWKRKRGKRENRCLAGRGPAVVDPHRVGPGREGRLDIGGGEVRPDLDADEDGELAVVPSAGGVGVETAGPARLVGVVALLGDVLAVAQDAFAGRRLVELVGRRGADVGAGPVKVAVVADQDREAARRGRDGVAQPAVPADVDADVAVAGPVAHGEG